MTATTVLRSWPGRAALVTTLAVVGGALTLLPGGSPTASAAGLVPWPDCDALLEHYRGELTRTATPWGVGGPGDFRTLEMATGNLDSGPAPAAARSSSDESLSAAVGTGPTGTNVQEQGVDEPDSVKTSGDLLLAVSGGSLHVLRAGPDPVLLSSVPLGSGQGGGGQGGGELLVDGDRALVLVPGWKPTPEAPQPVPEPLPEPGPVEPLPMPEPLPGELLPLPGGPLPGGPLPVEPDGGIGDVAPETVVSPAIVRSSPVAPMGEPVLHLTLVDLADPREPQVRETLELDGRYVSARLVDGTVRLVTSSTPVLATTTPVEPFGPEQERAALQDNRRRAATVTVDAVLPQAVRRGASGEELAAGPAVQCDDVARPASDPAGTTTLVVTTLRPGDGLAALDSTAVTGDGDLVYASAERLYVATSRWGTVAPAPSAPSSGEPTTQLHAFDTSSADQTRYVGSGSVPGFVYGRWALSSYDGHLRVATTLSPPWDGEGPTSSSVFVLAEDDGLRQVGRLDGLGPDERIYAVRYLGDLATVVTFRQTDPLYVLDLGDPASPRLLGELKIPGFSTYLHPIGDGALLGFGQEADAQGRVTGMQLSVFDLSDLSTPTQVDRLQLGDGWSPALDDSRAFSYDPDRRLAVLPLQTFDPAGGGGSQALGVRVGADLTLSEAGRLLVGTDAGVERVLLGDDAVYAVTSAGVVAADPADLSRTGAASFG